MIDMYGNQRLILKRLFRGRFSVDSMRAEISDWQMKYTIILMGFQRFDEGTKYPTSCGSKPVVLADEICDKLELLNN